MTTIAVSVDNQKELDKMRHGRERFNDIITRLVNGQFDLFIEFLFIDNELPYLHNAGFQAGTDADSVFYFDGQHAPRPSTQEEITKLMKQPKPNMTINREEAEIILKNFLHITRDDLPTSEHAVNFHNRLEQFLENQPK